MATDYRALAHAEAAIREANYRDAITNTCTRIVGDSLEVRPTHNPRFRRDPNETDQEARVRTYNERQERERQINAQRVSRDPCPMCGVRGDIGCNHRRAA